MASIAPSPSTWPGCSVMDARLIPFQGRDYRWTPEHGLDPDVVGAVENWIKRQAYGLTRAAARAGLTLDDLIQEGRLGALEAAHRFQPDQEANFLTWASYWIRNRIYRALGQGVVMIPRREWDQMLKEGTRLPVFSLDDLVPGTEEPWSSRLADVSEPATPPSRGVAIALGRLSRHHRELLLLRFGFAGEPLTLNAIGVRMGLTRERVRQIEAQALRCFRLAITRLDLPPRPIKEPAPKPQRQPKTLPRRTGSLPPTRSGAQPMSKPNPRGVQLTIPGAIRDRERERKAQERRDREARKARKQATAGTPLFPGDPARRSHE